MEKIFSTCSCYRRFLTMKKIFNTLLAIICICFGGSMYGMKRDNNMELTTRNTEQVKAVWLPADIIAFIASYCWPKEKNTLMRLSQELSKYLKENRILILKTNPSTVGLVDKVEAIIE